MAVSGKVSAATTASAAATLVVTTVAAHVLHGSVPADVLRLCEAGLTAASTFAAGWFAKHAPTAVVAVADEVASTLVADAPQEAEAVTPASIVVPPVGG